MEEKQKNTKNKFKTVEIEGKLITSDHEDFDNFFNSDIDEVPISKDELVIPIFNSKFNGFENSPDKNLYFMVEDHIGEKVDNNNEIKDLIYRTDPSSIENQYPKGKPFTESVSLGYLSVTPSNSGFISDIDFDDLIELSKK